MRETITAALKAATKAQDKRRISTLSVVSAAIMRTAVMSLDRCPAGDI